MKSMYTMLAAFLLIAILSLSLFAAVTRDTTSAERTAFSAVTDVGSASATTNTPMAVIPAIAPMDIRIPANKHSVRTATEHSRVVRSASGDYGANFLKAFYRPAGNSQYNYRTSV